MRDVTREEERAYVRNWADTGQLLEQLRWRELRQIDHAAALRATDALLAAAALVPVPLHRRRWSGLVELQDRLHRRPLR